MYPANLTVDDIGQLPHPYFCHGGNVFDVCEFHSTSSSSNVLISIQTLVMKQELTGSCGMDYSYTFDTCSTVSIVFSSMAGEAWSLLGRLYTDCVAVINMLQSQMFMITYSITSAVKGL
jgi:hypothetical protein